MHALLFDLFAPIGVGAALFLVANRVAILVTRAFPAWLGWSAMAIGAVALAPERVGDVGFVGLGVWTIVTTVVLVANRRAS